MFMYRELDLSMPIVGQNNSSRGNEYCSITDVEFIENHRAGIISPMQRAVTIVYHI